jgi:hypothetical protein
MIFTHVVCTFVPIVGQLAFHGIPLTRNNIWFCAFGLVVQLKINATGGIDLYTDLSTAHLRCRKELAKKTSRYHSPPSSQPFANHAGHSYILQAS